MANFGIIAATALTLTLAVQGCASQEQVSSLESGARVYVDPPAPGPAGKVLIHGTLCREGADPVSPTSEIAISKLHSDGEPATVTLAPLRERNAQCRFFTARSGWAFNAGDSLQLCITDKSRAGTPRRCELAYAG